MMSTTNAKILELCINIHSEIQKDIHGRTYLSFHSLTDTMNRHWDAAYHIGKSTQEATEDEWK